MGEEEEGGAGTATVWRAGPDGRRVEIEVTGRAELFLAEFRGGGDTVRAVLVDPDGELGGPAEAAARLSLLMEDMGAEPTAAGFVQVAVALSRAGEAGEIEVNGVTAGPLWGARKGEAGAGGGPLEAAPAMELSGLHLPVEAALMLGGELGEEGDPFEAACGGFSLAVSSAPGGDLHFSLAAASGDALLSLSEADAGDLAAVLAAALTRVGRRREAAADEAARP